MKKALPLVLIAAALPLAAAADVRVERTYTDDGRIIERRYYDNALDFGPYAAPAPVIREYPLTAWPGTAAIHTGANNSADQALADRVGQAIASDSRLDGITATIVANDGRVSLTGSAKSPEQASIAENVARHVAGIANVSGTLSSQGQ